jgi:hypothetical protein
MREEVDEKHQQMRAIERQRRSVELEQEINVRKRELEDIDRKFSDE